MVGDIDRAAADAATGCATGRAAVRGRLRHRLLVAVLPAPAAGARGEDRPHRSCRAWRPTPGDLAIVRAVVDLSRHFGLTVVAEGVESELTLELLEEIGCDIGQGFLFSRPLPYERLEAWLGAQTEPRADPAGRGPPAARGRRELRHVADAADPISPPSGAVYSYPCASRERSRTPP